MAADEPTTDENIATARDFVNKNAYLCNKIAKSGLYINKEERSKERRATPNGPACNKRRKPGNH
jgi:hypothetical protein